MKYTVNFSFLSYSPGAPVVDSSLIPISTESVQSISTVESVQSVSPDTQSVSPDTHTQSTMTVDNPNLKTLQKLEKKLKSIQELKAKRDKGIKLEANQVNNYHVLSL